MPYIVLRVQLKIKKGVLRNCDFKAKLSHIVCLSVVENVYVCLINRKGCVS